MTQINSPISMQAPPRSQRRGFTFTEIMFAVVILGIGFIMIASIFPVAIRLSSQSAEDSLSVTASDRVMQSFRKLLIDSAPPSTTIDNPAWSNPYTNTTFLSRYTPPFVALGESYTFGAAPTVITPAQAAEMWTRTRGSLISDDGRMGLAVAFARRGSTTYNAGTVLPADSVVQLIMVVAQMRDRARFNDDLNAVNSLSGTVDQPAALKRLKDLTVPLTSTTDQFNPYTSGTWNKNFDQQYVSRVTSFVDHSTPATLQLKRLQARFFIGENGEADTVQLWSRADGNSPSGWTTTAGMTTGSVTAMAPGTFLIVSYAGNYNYTSADNATTQIKKNNGVSGIGSTSITDYNTKSHGTVVRLGKQLAEMTSNSPAIFELVPGQDISSLNGTDDLTNVGSTTISGKITAPPYGSSTSVSPQTVEVLALGRSLKDPTQLYDRNTNPYVGPAMDVAVFSSFVVLP